MPVPQPLSTVFPIHIAIQLAKSTDGTTLTGLVNHSKKYLRRLNFGN